MSEVSKVVFVAFTQHCIQSTVTHIGGVKGVLYSIYSGLSPLPGGKAICYSTVFEKPSILGVQWFNTSQSEEAALLTFLDLSTTRVIAGKTHSQSPILKNKGALSNPVILTYLWEQSCILHTLTKVPA